MSTPKPISPEHPLKDAKIRLDKLPADGRTVEIEADAEERAAIAARMRVDIVNSFAAHALARPIKGGMQVTGSLEAELVQSCVVTFDPVMERVMQSFERVFLSGSPEGTQPKPGAEVFVDLEGDDLPDYFDGPDIDLTELLMEVLALNINPYPRAPDAELPEDARDEGNEKQSPFAALEALKKPRD